MGNLLQQKDNSIFIPKIGTSKVTDNIQDVTIKHQNLIQIVLNKNIVEAKYLALFFNTKIGQLILGTLLSGTVIQHINKDDIQRSLVPIPDLPLQNKIIDSDKKLRQLKEKINSFEEEIALSPGSVENIEMNLNKMLNSLNMLNESDKILSLIREGENKEIEFKSTLRKPIKKDPTPENVIEKMTLKTIAGFLNASEGTLLVGVDDKGNILGLDNDGFKTDDDMLKHVENLIQRDFDPKFFDLIDYKIVKVYDKKVLVFNCKQSKEPVFWGKEEEFYVRTNPATEKLKGKKQYSYINSHFHGELK